VNTFPPAGLLEGLEGRRQEQHLGMAGGFFGSIWHTQEM